MGKKAVVVSKVAKHLKKLSKKKPVTKKKSMVKKHAMAVDVPKPFKMPKIHVPSKKQLQEKIRKATPWPIRSAAYWKLKKLKDEHAFQKKYQQARRKVIAKTLSRKYASKLVRDHMRRKVNTLRREHALQEYGPVAHYKPFHWGKYSENEKSDEHHSEHQHKEMQKAKPSGDGAESDSGDGAGSDSGDGEGDGDGDDLP